MKQAIADYGPGRDDAIDALSGRWVELDALTALAFARQTSDRETKDSIESTYYGMWADHDPDGALKAARNWYRADSSAAAQWVNQLPAGPLYDEGARGICTALNGNLTPTLKWARSIRDPKIRHDEVYHAFEASTHSPYRPISDSPRIKDEIQGALELTDADKNALIAGLPVFQPFLLPQLPVGH